MTDILQPLEDLLLSFQNICLIAPAIVGICVAIIYHFKPKKAKH